MKDRMVAGLDRVSPTVEDQAASGERAPSPPPGAAGAARKLVTPSQPRNSPPSSDSQKLKRIRNEETAVRPKAATAPYRVSAVAAPRPVARPMAGPWASE